jgi:hypothetical protein
MNILIISNVRCGGYYFMSQLSERYNLKPIHEPKEFIISDGICVKLLSDWPINNVDEIIKYSKNFDYVFLLDRKNLEEQFKSIYVIYELTKNKTAPWYWNEKYETQDDFKIKEKIYKDWLLDKSKNIKEISNILNKDILYYEDLYYNTEVCHLQGLKFNPDTSKKLYSSTLSEFESKKNII